MDGWDDINSSGGTIGTGINKAIHRLVISIANLRSSVSSQLTYVKGKIESLNQSFEQLNENIQKADQSSTKLARALNKLTFWAVVIAALGLLNSLGQFLYQNKLWPFSQ